MGLFSGMANGLLRGGGQSATPDRDKGLFIISTGGGGR